MTLLRVLLCVLYLIPTVTYAQPTSMPRVLIALYDSREEYNPRTTLAHRFLEMPANHLGFDMHYYDVNAPLPPLGDEVKGVVIWFNSGNEIANPKPYLDWLEDAVTRGKKLVIIENSGIGEKHHNSDALMQQYNRILSHIGIQDSNGWNAITYNTQISHIDPSVAGFERQIGPVLPPFGNIHVIPGKAESHLQITVKQPEEDNVVDLITTSPNGGYVADSYAVFYVIENEESKISQWFVNPFTFLSRSLAVERFPVPDITTYFGKRIFYSHIDGDGWNNISEIARYNETNTVSAEVIRKEIIQPYNDFAFTVGLITADVDPDCYGVRDSEKVAREIFALPNVEPSSHTHSHPLYWHYFANYTPEKERPLLSRYPTKTKQRMSMLESIKETSSNTEWKGSSFTGDPHDPHALDSFKPGRNDDSEEDTLKKYYHTPRNYACTPFNIDEEISGSMMQVNALAPEHKKARLIQWSGDTSPFAEALKKAREAGLYNINGGDSRFDNEYPSYSSVSPIGLRVGKERQIYSSNSNENTYTRLWTGRFFGFRYLQTTVRNTEEPMRVRPFNIYFHMYSGEKDASLHALKENFEFARTQNVIPVTASDYAAIANGFYSTNINKLGDGRWQISNRGQLQTMRFDDGLGLSVNFPSSDGVIGQNYAGSSLYVLLDPEVESPVIVLKNNNKNGILPTDTLPYLIESRWPVIKRLRLGKSMLTIQALGYGRGNMSWKMPQSGNYLIRARKTDGDQAVLFESRAASDSYGVLNFTIDVMTPAQPLSITIEQIEK